MISRKTYLFPILIALILVTFTLFSEPSYAQTTPAPTTPPTSTSSSSTSVICSLDPTNPLCGVATVASGVASAAGSAIKGAASNALADAAKGVALAIVGIADFFLGISGMLLNLVIFKTVFQFASLIGNSSGLLIAWGILRDIGNMLLLFGFIFMGLATILDLHTYNVKKALPQLVIFAILMNFSLFAAEAVIDVSNGLTTAMYAQSDTSNCGGLFSGGTVTATAMSATDAKTAETCAVNYGIAGHIMQSTGLSSVWNTGDAQGNAQNLTGTTATFIALALFATVGAIVLFAATIMLVIRAITLTLLMVTAPIGFAGMAIPPLRGAANQWWNRLIHQAFFAPILFLLLLVSLKISDAFAGSSNAGLGGALLSPNASVMGIVLVFALVIGFMIASLMAARAFGAQGATMAIGLGTNIMRGAYGGVGGFLGRRTIAPVAARVQKSYETSRGARLIAGSALDTSITAGLNRAKNAKFGSSESMVDRKKRITERNDHLEHEVTKKSNSDELEEAIKTEDDKKVAGILQKMSQKDIEETKYVKEAANGIDIIARNLSPEKFEKMMGNKDLSEAAKHNLAHRFEPLSNSLSTIEKGFKPGATSADLDAAKTAQGEVRKWSIKDLEQFAKIDPEDYEKLIKLQNDEGDSIISSEQFDKLKDSNELTTIQKQITKDNSLSKRIENAVDAGNTLQAQKFMSNIAGSKNKAKLSAKVLTDSTIGGKLSGHELQAIATEDKLKDADRRKLATIVQTRLAAGEKDIVELMNPMNVAVVNYFTP